ncbi:flippase [uncultured Psychroserpens sp.]|uniref:flippase n=1 Tax=uncultured Psychroserpens sp. TaxID=255436 RepID=UPI002624EA09|nr:flippase [uncultured Psychroserpens sp.]
MNLIEKLKYYFNNSLVNKSLKVLFLRIIGVVLFFSLTLILTNYFDPNLVGQYDFTRSLLIFLGGICVFGMHQSVIYYSGLLTSRNALDSLKSIYKKMTVIVFFISAVVFILFYFIDDTYINIFFEKEVASIVVKTVATLFFYSITMLNIDVFRGINKIFISEFYRNIFRYLPFLIGIIIIYNIQEQGFLIDLFLLNFLILSIISTGYLFVYFSNGKGSSLKIEITYKDIIKRSGPMAISSIAYVLMQSVDIILLSKFTNFESVAFYAVAIKLTTMISLVLASVNTVQAPKIAELYSLKNFKELNKIIKSATRLIFLLTFPIIIGLAVLSNVVLKWYGEAYLVAQTALFILLAGQSINALCGSVGVYMNMTGKQNVLQKILLFSFFLNLILNWYLIPLYGINGAAFSTSFSMIFWNITTVVYIYKKDKIKTFLHANE